MKICLCMSVCIHAVSYSHYKQADITCTSREEQATRRQILTERKGKGIDSVHVSMEGSQSHVYEVWVKY